MNTLSSNFKYNGLYISNNKNNLIIKNLHQNTLNINSNINEIKKKIEITQTRLSLLEESTNRKLYDLFEQLKIILSKLPSKEENKNKFYNTSSNFYSHKYSKDNSISKIVLNNITKKRTNSFSKKNLNNSNNINSKIRLMIQKEYFDNNATNEGNHFAPLSLNVDKK